MSLSTLPITATYDADTKRVIVMLNASLYKESNCLRKVQLKAILGLGSGGTEKDYKMEYGTAFHKALVVLYSKGTLEAAIQAAFDHFFGVYVPDNEWRNSGHLIKTIMDYHNTYGKADMLTANFDLLTNKPMLEQTFAIPFYRTDRVEILLCGTIDMIGTYMGQLVIVDHKTTSLTQIETYLRSYELSPQLLTYVYVHSVLFPGISVGAMINGIFLGRTGKNNFKRSDIFNFSENHLASFKYHLTQRAEAIAENLEAQIDNIADAFPPNYTCCEQKFGQCEYAPICLCTTPSDMLSIANSNYIAGRYDPLRFQA